MADAFSTALASLEFGAPAVRAVSSTQRERKLPPLSQEDRDSLLDSITSNLLSGLAWVGETLDKPDRAIRGTIAGRSKSFRIRASTGTAFF